jgi:hypothetical protein
LSAEAHPIIDEQDEADLVVCQHITAQKEPKQPSRQRPPAQIYAQSGSTEEGLQWTPVATRHVFGRKQLAKDDRTGVDDSAVGNVQAEYWRLKAKMVVMGLCICQARSKTSKQPISESDESASEEPTLCIALKPVSVASIYENPQAEEKTGEEERFPCMTAYNLTV